MDFVCLSSEKRKKLQAHSAPPRSTLMDGLGSIRPEIEEFVSRENRRHADPWLQQVDWANNERTLKLYTRKPPPGQVQHVCIILSIYLLFLAPRLVTVVASVILACILFFLALLRR